MFGDKLRALRNQAHKTQMEVVAEIQQQFGDQIRMSQTNLSALEGRSSAPREDVLTVLAEYYGVPVTYFFQPEPKRESLARAYLESLRNRTFREGLPGETSDHPLTTIDNFRFWQCEFPDDEYLED